MEEMTVERAVEILNRVKHRGHDDWRWYRPMKFASEIVVCVNGTRLNYDSSDAVIIASWYEGRELLR